MKKIRIFASIIGITLLLLIPTTLVFSNAKEELEAELKKIEAQISQYEKTIATTQVEKQTLANKISQLKKEQSKVQLQIKTISVEIKMLDNKLFVTNTSIKDNTQKLSLFKQQISDILQTINNEGDKSIFEIILADKEISVIFNDLESLAKLSENLTEKINGVRIIKKGLENKYSEFEDQQNEKKDLLAIQSLQQQKLDTKTKEQNKLLSDTKGKEAQYQTMLANSKKQAQEIRNRIYELLGVGKQITFGEAVELAKWASEKTEVRPALLLAILTQESNLGKNIGTCNRAGDPASKSWKNVMKPSRDQAPFLLITKELRMDPNTSPVSCPMRDANGNQIGWGGAMGPAQFIPSTWILYKDRVARFTGASSANPWDTRDAFIAAALLMKDNGAVAGNEKSEWTAAMLYFSGSTNTRFRFYGDNVLALAKRYEEDIKTII